MFLTLDFSLLRYVLLQGLQRAWTTVWKKEMPSLTVVVFGMLLPFFNPCTAETSVYPCRSCLLISLLTLMYVCALALLNRSCCIRWSIVSYTKVLILKFCNVQFRFNFIPPHFEWTMCVLFKRSHVKFIGIVRAWRKDSIFESFFQGSELLPATPTHMENLNLAVQN